MRLQIFYDDTTYKFRGWRNFKKLVAEIIQSEGKTTGAISFIITSDENLRAINKEFLSHDYFTDVITFNYSTNDTISGEIYISEETVRKNSVDYNVTPDNEMLRVMIHGILHLLGHNDETDTEKLKMTQLEDRWICQITQ